jgi:hypothetical protein
MVLVLNKKRYKKKGGVHAEIQTETQIFSLQDKKETTSNREDKHVIQYS